MLYMIFGGAFLTYIKRPMGRLTVQEQKLEGEYRFINSRLIANSEEVAFYSGNSREKVILLAAFHKLVSYMIRA
jgi:ATP-binding cassette subfamily D (ALD) protein 3